MSRAFENISLSQLAELDVRLQSQSSHQTVTQVVELLQVTQQPQFGLVHGQVVRLDE